MSSSVLLFVLALVQGAGQAPTPAPALAPARKPVVFTIANTSGHVIHAVYISPTKSPKWGQNLLKGSLVRGQALSLAVAGGCGRYDIRMVAEGRTELFEDDVEFCEAGHQLRVMDTQLEKKKVQ